MSTLEPNAKNADTVTRCAPTAVHPACVLFLHLLTRRKARLRAHVFPPSTAVGHGHSNSYPHFPNGLIAAIANFKGTAKLMRLALVCHGQPCFFEVIADDLHRVNRAARQCAAS
jgi:hypothetical protein